MFFHAAGSDQRSQFLVLQVGGFRSRNPTELFELVIDRFGRPAGGVGVKVGQAILAVMEGKAKSPGEFMLAWGFFG
ncbi:hypothetical protein [Gordonia rhizosphera]|uniref:hypothetical protein n=1 Tax=Gordonia rhizosphera TaxID=83341 RepID=UPI00058BD09A|nr:hypothetical protein [Gordonia rhizosphera]